jgi:allophanate hydrolase subunit 1
LVTIGVNALLYGFDAGDPGGWCVVGSPPPSIFDPASSGTADIP